MPDNSAYRFGLDFYEGNSVRDWTILANWNMRPMFAYFRLGIGLHADKTDLIDGCHKATTWDIGQYYEVWTPDDPKDAQLKVIRDHIHPVATLPLWMGFEPQTSLDKKGNKVTDWPSVGDLQYLIANVPGSICYTNLAGLTLIVKTLGKIPQDWKFSIARYLDSGVEASVGDTLALIQSVYGIDPARILFIQTSKAGAYPAGASYDKGADYDRMMMAPTPAPPPEPSPLAAYVVSSPSGLRIRQAADPNALIVGGLHDKDTIYGGKVGDWIKLDGYVSAQFVTEPGPSQPPAPAPKPAGKYFQAFHDFQMPPEFLPRMLQRGTDLKSDKGYPETLNILLSNDDPGPVDLNRAVQGFIYQQLRLAAPGMGIPDLKKAFTSLLGAHLAFANGTGFPQNDGDSPHANYMTGEDLGSPDPKLDRPRTTKGNVYLVPDPDVTWFIGNEECYRIQTIKANALPNVNDVNFEKTPWLVSRCVTSTPYPATTPFPGLPTGGYKCNRFPQLDGNDVPMPLITNTGWGFLPKRFLSPVPDPFAVVPYVV